MKPFTRAVLGLSVAVLSMAFFLPGAAVSQVPVQVEESEVFPHVDDDFDARVGSVAPSAEQQAIVSALGAHVTWNRFGTPQSLIKYGGFLATGLSTEAEQGARQFVEANSALFRLSQQEAAALELLNDSPMARSSGHAVIFRQRFGELASGQDGLITVGITGGKVAYVSSSAAGNQGTPGPASLSATEAWLRAAANIGRSVSPSAITNVGQDFSWTSFRVAGFTGLQRVRLRALAMPGGSARPAYEVIVLDHKAFVGYTMYVDAQTGQVWWRQNQVEQFASEAVPQLSQFTATYVAPACGPFHGPYTAPPGTTQIDVYALGTPPVDIILNLHHPQGTIVASSDIPAGENPEVIHYAPIGGVPAGNYFVQVCPFDPNQSPPASTYSGAIIINDASVQVPYPPKWKVFPAYPLLDLTPTDLRQVWCWEHPIAGNPVPECQREVRNPWARAPWDLNVRTGVPTFTTIGNAANSAEQWLNPAAPGEGQGIRPVANDRRYIFDSPWPNSWEESKCDPAQLTQPGISNDIRAAVVNLFAMHNRMHDWTYALGFTEINSNGQEYNFGNTLPNRENDPEVGGAQAGALVSTAPPGGTRNNANQLTLPDGVPGVTNMFLWQPRPASAYPPCVDGDYDMQVIAHEFTHFVSNRMVAGPDTNLSGDQAGQMGESWSDLNAVEYLQEYGFAPVGTENPFAVGVYVTGNPDLGIRNYATNDSPLNYSNIGYDLIQAENNVHANGEIWSATNIDIRSALNAKYDGQFPSSNATLQRECADGLRNPSDCPGNRRWIQIMHDAFLLMPGATSMLDARDAYLAADVMRFGGDNQVELWRAFAKRGMGEFAFSNTNNDANPKPSFESAEETNEATVTFDATAPDESGAHVNANIYVGHYQARAVAIADTDPANDGNPPGPGENLLDATAKFVPGTYEMVAQAPGYGHRRFSMTVSPGQTTTLSIGMFTNWASSTKGAVASGDGAGHGNLIDDNENTQWSVTASVGSADGTQVTVALAGPKRINRVQVSSAGSSRFSALRQFAIHTCNAAPANLNCTAPGSFTNIFTSPADAFPGVRWRPVTPALALRSFAVPNTTASHVRIVMLKSQCSGGPDFTDTANPDNDPLNTPDCVNGSTAEQTMRATELQVFACRVTSRRMSIPC
jgi:extracellular elastinolytic metalloproteinase